MRVYIDDRKLAKARAVITKSYQPSTRASGQRRDTEAPASGISLTVFPVYFPVRLKAGWD